ncbi:MAG TPA: transmembrane prediction, partial [Rhodopirellula sp.]|nr:transmembrane prediction [Rhodopirellula sp.]
MISAAQFQRGFRSGRGPVANRNDYPAWTLDKGFEEDVFTFARIQYDSMQYRPGRQWDNDFPDCDWNFSARLQELT